jgi:hypothetical protein
MTLRRPGHRSIQCISKSSKGMSEFLHNMTITPQCPQHMKSLDTLTLHSKSKSNHSQFVQLNVPFQRKANTEHVEFADAGMRRLYAHCCQEFMLLWPRINLFLNIKAGQVHCTSFSYLSLDVDPLNMCLYLSW